MSNKGQSANHRRLENGNSPYILDVDANGGNSKSFQGYLGSPSVSNHYKVNLNLAKVGPGGAAGVDGLSQWLTSAGVFGNAEPQRFDFLCSETMLPGTSVETFTELGSRQGLEEFFPTRKVYQDLSMTFYVSSDYRILKLFQEWMNFINPLYDANAGKLQSASPGGYPSLRDVQSFHRHRYPIEYRREISVTKFERDIGSLGARSFGPGNKLMYVFLNAFPININSVPLTYDEAQVLKITVDFKYDRYTLVHTGQPVTPAQKTPEATTSYSNEKILSSSLQNVPSSGLNDLRAPWDAGTPSPFTVETPTVGVTKTLKDFDSPLLNKAN